MPLDRQKVIGTSLGGDDVCSGGMGFYPYAFYNVFYAKINKLISNKNVFYIEIREKKN